MLDLIQAFSLLGLAGAVLMLGLAVRSMQREIAKLRRGEFVPPITRPSNDAELLERINRLGVSIREASRTPIRVSALSRA